VTILSRAMAVRVLAGVLAAGLLGPGLPAVAAAEGAPATRYTMTDLGTLGGAGSDPMAVSDSGTVVGQANRADGSKQAFLWANGKMTDLGTLGGAGSVAFGVNAADQAVGQADTPTGEHAVLWDHGSMHDLHPAGATSSAAFAINNAGLVVGTARGGPYGPLDQAIWWKAGTSAPLPLQPAPSSVQTLSVNEAGHVVGSELTAHAMSAIVTVIAPTGIDWATPTATPRVLPYLALRINGAGQVAGVAGPNVELGSSGHPVLVQGDQQTNLDDQLPPGSTWRGVDGQANGINDAGQVVGYESDSASDEHAFLWDRGQGIDLNEVTKLPTGWELASAIAINNHGQIAAWADGSNLPQGHAVLLTPVSAAATSAPKVSAATSSVPPSCQLVLGFKVLHDLVPSTVGNCLDDEGHNPANGDALQHTSGGLLVWRKADNWTAFTDGYHTWVNGPYGLHERLNTQRFSWEANPDGLPVVR
jgi:probable HAF family extracellular repeat protein